MWLMYEANCSSPHELLSLPFLPTSTREVMASEDGKTDPRPFRSPFVRLLSDKALWRTRGCMKRLQMPNAIDELLRLVRLFRQQAAYVSVQIDL